MSSRLVMGIVMAAFTFSVTACRSQAPPSETESAASDTGARVFFVAPKDGETLSSKTLARFEFGSDRYQIAAVPAGEITEAQVRPGMGHFHLGVDSDCLPAGADIPKAEAGATPGVAGSWIHFGTGSNFIEMSLTPGPHTFSVQVGDDLHRAVEGLCETINVTVE